MYDAYLRFVTKDRINKIDAKREQYRTPPDSGHANPFFGLANIVKDESETWDSPSSKPAASKTTPPPCVILNGVKNLPLPYPMTVIPCSGPNSLPAKWKSPPAPTAP